MNNTEARAIANKMINGMVADELLGNLADACLKSIIEPNGFFDGEQDTPELFAIVKDALKEELTRWREESKG